MSLIERLLQKDIPYEYYDNTEYEYTTEFDIDGFYRIMFVESADPQNYNSCLSKSFCHEDYVGEYDPNSKYIKVKSIVCVNGKKEDTYINYLNDDIWKRMYLEKYYVNKKKLFICHTKNRSLVESLCEHYNYDENKIAISRTTKTICRSVNCSLSRNEVNLDLFFTMLHDKEFIVIENNCDKSYKKVLMSNNLYSSVNTEYINNDNDPNYIYITIFYRYTTFSRKILMDKVTQAYISCEMTYGIHFYDFTRTKSPSCLKKQNINNSLVNMCIHKLHHKSM